MKKVKTVVLTPAQKAQQTRAARMALSKKYGQRTLTVAKYLHNGDVKKAEQYLDCEPYVKNTLPTLAAYKANFNRDGMLRDYLRRANLLPRTK